jgi:hypothetical protein
MEPHRDEDRLAEDLRALKPTPRPQFAAKLDERAAAGFPRRSREDGAATGSQLAPLLDWLRSLRPRRILVPAGGLAVIAVAIATALVASGGSDDERRSALGVTAPSSGAEHSPGSGPAAGAGGGAAGLAKQPSGTQYSSPVAPSEASAEEVPAEVEKYQRSMNTSAAGAADVQSVDGSLGINRMGGVNRPRAVERSAQIVLAAEPGDVAEDAAKVFETVRAHNGVVMRSSTSQGAAGDAGARFELLIPSAKLGDALADLSAIDEVRSRREATADITAPTVNIGELLQDSKARIDSLLGQLEGSETESAREAVEAELRQERRHRARLRGQLQQLQKRADLSRVSLRIETGAGDDSSSGGAWGVDDALRDAGKILSVAAAVTLVALAVIAPIALVALLAWLTHRAWVRRERRRVLS